MLDILTSRSNNQVQLHIYEINENVTEKFKIIYVHFFCLFRVKQLGIIVMNE